MAEFMSRVCEDAGAPPRPDVEPVPDMLPSLWSRVGGYIEPPYIYAAVAAAVLLMVAFGLSG